MVFKKCIGHTATENYTKINTFEHICSTLLHVVTTVKKINAKRWCAVSLSQYHITLQVNYQKTVC
jgi:hypothetical protein